MALQEMTDDGLLVFQWEVQSFERGNIGSPTREVNPGCVMSVNEEIVVEIYEFELMTGV